MKYLFVVLMLCCCSIEGRAQSDSLEVRGPIYSVRPGFNETYKKQEVKLDEFQQRHLYKAGRALERSTNCLIASVSSATVSGVCFTVGAATGKNKTATYITGGLFAGASLACMLFAISFRSEAGLELRLSAGEVVFKF